MWRELNDQSAQWNFLQAQSFIWGAFLQSPAWGDFLRQENLTTKTLGYFESNKIVGLAQLVRLPLTRGLYYWFAPKGPVFAASKTPEEKNIIQKELIDCLGDKKNIFTKLESELASPRAVLAKDVNPRATTIVNLLPGYSDILESMHEKTRYNIRLAERKGLVWRWGGVKDFEIFWGLLKATAKRENFRPHSEQHYRLLLSMFVNEPLTTKTMASRLVLVEKNGEPLAASLIVISNKQATYLHGASSREHRELMAPYLLHAGTLRELIDSGCQTYDFWGIEPVQGDKPSWSGFTRFKLGFGGQRYESLGARDYPNNKPMYYLYRLAKSLR